MSSKSSSFPQTTTIPKFSLFPLLWTEPLWVPNLISWVYFLTDLPFQWVPKIWSSHLIKTSNTSPLLTHLLYQMVFRPSRFTLSPVIPSRCYLILAQNTTKCNKKISRKTAISLQKLMKLTSNSTKMSAQWQEIFIGHS